MEIYATAIALDDCTAVLLLGDSGSGKSSVALRLLDAGAKLVGDDRVLLHCDGDVLCVSSHARGCGLIEARGLGIFQLPDVQCAQNVPVVMAVELVSDAPERMAEPTLKQWLGVAVPCWSLWSQDVALVAKLRLLVRLYQPAGGLSMR